MHFKLSKPGPSMASIFRTQHMWVNWELVPSYEDVHIRNLHKVIPGNIFANDSTQSLYGFLSAKIKKP